MTPTETSAIAPFLALQPDEVARELRVVTPNRLRQPYLLHMSKNTQLTMFSPQVTRRVLADENRSIPRISTAPTLAGCLMSYSSDLTDFAKQQNGLSADGREVKFRGGWAIYALPFDLALRPSRRLVPDVNATDEHWLVSYDAEHRSYPAEMIGRFFYEQVSYIARGRQRITEIVMYVEVKTKEVRFDHRRVLTPGCWRLKVRGLHNARSWNAIESVEVEQIEDSLFTNIKRNVASLLSLDEPLPAVTRW